MKRTLLIILTIISVACARNAESLRECSIRGYAQKGQFVKGSQVTAFALDLDLVATGESFPASISDDLGSFGVSGKTGAPYFDLRAEGYYFNEMEGVVSSSPIYLEAIVRSDDTVVNINLMTTAIYPRVKHLIKNGKTYESAVIQAQNEFLGALGFTGTTALFSDMDITGTSDGDGMLLALACMVQNNRGPSEVSTLIQEVAFDLESDGELSAAVLDKIRAKVSDINPYKVIENLAKYYSGKNLSVTTVPEFYRFLDNRYDVPFKIVDGPDTAVNPGFGEGDSELLADSGQIDVGIDVLATIDFTVETDFQGLDIVKTNILGPAYHISFQVPANTELSGRTVHVVFKDASGNVLDSRTFVQGGGYRAVDLGLSVYWADHNIGASSPEDAGDFYAWGEVETKDAYEWSSYKWYSVTAVELGENTYYEISLRKYTLNDNHNYLLDSEDDVAHVKLDGAWRMPTEEEWAELEEKCTCTWTTQNNVKGMLITSTVNGNSIFLPATGMKVGTDLYSVNTGYYWTSSLSPNRSFGFGGGVAGVPADDCFDAVCVDVYGDYLRRRGVTRDSGLSVRPVAEKAR